MASNVLWAGVMNTRVCMLYLAASLAAGCAPDSPDSEPLAEATDLRADCEQLRAHVVELQLQDLTERAFDEPAVATALDGHRRNLNRALGPDMIERCVQSMSRSYTECALQASNRAELRACR